MKNYNIILSFIFFGISHNLNAQIPTVSWTYTNAPSTSTNVTLSVHIHSDSKIVTVGVINGKLALRKFSSSASLERSRNYSNGSPSILNFRKNQMRSMLDASDNLYLIQTILHTDSTKGNASLLKYDNNIKLRWERNMDSLSSAFKCMDMNTQNDILVGGSFKSKNSLGQSISKAFFQKYSKHGNLLLTHIIADSLTYINFTVNDVAFDQSNNIYVCGSVSDVTQKQTFYIAKYDSLGTFIWRKFYNNTSTYKNDKAETLLVDLNNDVYVAGSIRKVLGPDGFQYLLVKYSPSGIKLWHKTYLEDTEFLLYTVPFLGLDSSNNIHVAYSIGTFDYISHSSVKKFTTAGTKMWETNLNAGYKLEGMKVSTAGYVYLISNYIDYETAYERLVQINPSGTNIYNDNTVNITTPHCILYGLDLNKATGEVLVAGTKHDLDNNDMPFDLQTVIRKYSNVGLRNRLSVNDNEANVFPNPTQGELNIEVADEILKLQFYDTQGALVSEKMGSNKIAIDDFKPGLYLLRIFTETEIITQRILKK